MKKEYRASFTQYGEPDRWLNAGAWCEKMKRTFKTEEEARAALEHVKQLFPDKAHKDVMQAGYFGVESYCDAEMAHKLAVKETRIEVREVTEWETI